MSKHQSSHEVKQGFRTWKSGKSWLYAAGAFIVLAGVVGARTESSVKADSVTTAPTSAVTSSAASAAVTESSTTGNLSSNSTSEVSVSSNQAVSVAKSTISGSSDNSSSASVAETSQSSSGKNTVENSNSSEPSQRTTSTSSNTNPSTASSSSATGSLSSNSTSEASVSSNQAVSVAKSTISGSSDSPSSASVAETSQSSSGKNAVENSNSSESSLRTTSTSSNTNLSTASSSSAIGTSPNNSSTQAIAAKPLTLVVSDQSENSMTSTTSATYDVSSYVDSTKLNEGTTASGAEVIGVHTTVSWGKQVIRAGNSIIEQGEVWAPSQNFLSCTDSDGNSVPWSDKIQVSGSVDFDTPGTYSVEYGFTDPKTKNLAYTLASIIVQPEIVQPETIADVGVGYIDKSKSVVASGYMIDPATNGDSFTYPEKSSIAEMDGTARWTLDNQGNLSISAGKVGTGIFSSNYDTSNNSASVSSYFGNPSPTRDIVKSITLTGPLQLNGYGYDLFSNFQNLTTINGLNNLSLSSDIISIRGLFQNDPLLKSVDLSSLDTSNITDMSSLFFEDASLSSVNLKGVNTKNVTDMSSMFSGCNSLPKVDLSGFDTSNVTNMSYMFSLGDVSTNNALTNIIGLNHFNTKKVTDFSCMFAGNNALTQLDLSSFDMTSAKSTSTDSQGNTTYTVGSMLSGLTSLKQLSLGEKTVIQGSDLPNPNISQDGTYTGAWQNVGKGTLTQPKGNYVLSSAQLSGSGVVWYDENNNSHTLADSSYDGKAMSGIYVWQKAEPTKEEATNNSGIADNGKAVGNLNGTATWKLYNDGTLYIHGGTIAYQEDNIQTVLSNDNANPFWNKYTSQIKNIIIDGNLTSQSTSVGLTLPDNSTSDLTNGTVDDAQEIAGKIAGEMISSMGNEDSASDQANKDLSLGLAKDSVGVLIDFGQALSSGSGATLSHLFANLSNLVSIQGLKNLDTSNVTDMSDLFSGDFKLLSLDLSHFDTKNVVNMKNMFAYDSNLQYISGLDSVNFLTTNNYDYSNLFAGDSSLTALNLKNFDMRASLNSIPDSENLYQITYGDGLPKTIIEALTAGWSKGTIDSGVYINYQGKSIIKTVIDTTKAAIDTTIATINASIAATEGGATPFVAAELAALEIASSALGQVTYESVYDNGNVDETTDINGDLTQIISGNGNQAATSKMLDSTTNLQKLTLGSYTALTNSGLGIAGEEGDQIGSSGYWDNLAPFYTLKWQNFTPSDTTINNPTGTSVKSVSELTNSYTGGASAPSLTYVWQPANYSITAQDLRVPVGASWNIMDNLKLAFLDGKTSIYLNDQPIQSTDSAWLVNAWYEGNNLHQGTDDYFTTVPGNYSIVYSVDGERMTSPMDVNVVVQGKGTYSNTVDKADNGNVIWNFTGNQHQGDDYDNTSSIVGTYTGTNGKKGIIHLSPFSTDNGDLTGKGDVSGYYSGTDGNGTISGTYNSGILNLIFTPWKVTLASKNSTLTVGADWKPIDNLKTATDPSGNDLMVNYFSSYSYFDGYEGNNLNNEIIPIPGECGIQVVVYNSAGKIVAQDVANANGGADFDKTFLNTAGTYKVVYQLSVRNADASITTYSTTATLNVVNPQSTNTGTSSNSSSTNTSSAGSSSSSSTSISNAGSSNSSSTNTSNTSSSNTSVGSGNSSSSSTSSSSAGSSSSSSSNTGSTGSSSASSENSGASTNSNASNSTDNLLNDVSISTNNITINQNATFSMKDLVNNFTNVFPDANGNGDGKTIPLLASGVVMFSAIGWDSQNGESLSTATPIDSATYPLCYILPDGMGFEHGHMGIRFEVDVSKVDTSKAGTYTVTYKAIDMDSMTLDKINNPNLDNLPYSGYDTKVLGTSTVTVVAATNLTPPSEPAGQTTTTNGTTVTTTGTGANAGIVLNAKNLTFPAGTPWSAVKSYISGTDKGKEIDFNQLKIISNDVNPNVPGIYHITFCYGDPVTITATVTVYSSSTTGNNSSTTGQTAQSGQTVKNIAGTKTMAYAPTKTSPVVMSMNTTKSLPTTGEKSDNSLLVLGMGLLAMTTFTFLYSGFKRKNRNQ